MFNVLFLSTLYELNFAKKINICPGIFAAKIFQTLLDLTHNIYTAFGQDCYFTCKHVGLKSMDNERRSCHFSMAPVITVRIELNRAIY